MPFARVKDVTLWYELHGPEDGEPLVFVSGTGVHGRIWKTHQIPYFAQRGYRCLIYDHRGTGESDKPRLKYSVRMFADDLAALMDELDMADAHILGHSMGGRVCQWMGLDHPHKVRSLILCATGPGKTHKFKDHALGVPFATALELAEKGFEQYLADHFGGAFFAAEDYASRPDFAANVSVWTSYPPPLHAYLRHVVARQEHFAADRLYELRMPTLVICGDDDTQPSGTGNHVEESRELHRGIPGSDLILIPGARHAFLDSHAKEANEAIDRWIREKGIAGPAHAKVDTVVHIPGWDHLPDSSTPLGVLVEESKADVVLPDGRRYRQDWPGANFDGIGQRYARIRQAEHRGVMTEQPRVFVNVANRSDVYCLGVGPLDRAAVEARWNELEQ